MNKIKKLVNKISDMVLAFFDEPLKLNKTINKGTEIHSFCVFKDYGYLEFVLVPNYVKKWDDTLLAEIYNLTDDERKLFCKLYGERENVLECDSVDKPHDIIDITRNSFKLYFKRKIKE